MNYAKITKLRYRDANPKIARDTSVVDVIYDHDGETGQFTIGNPTWDYNNPFLQFCAVYGWQPTDFEGTTIDVSDTDRYVPMNEHGTPNMEQIFDGAVKKLEEAEWFEPANETDDTDGPAPHEGGSPDPGTGNRGGVRLDEESDHQTDSSGGVEEPSEPETADS